MSGDTADVQLVTLAAVTGSEGAYTVREVFYADDAAFTPGTGGVLATGLLFDDVAPDSVDEGDIGIQRMSSRREAYVQLRDAAGNERGMVIDASGFPTVNVNGTVTVGSHAVTNAGTFVTQIDGAALTSLQLADDTVYVDDAAWTGDTSKHNLVGGIYQSTPQTVTDGRTAPFNITTNGALHVSVQGTVTVAAHAVTNAGTFVTQIDGAALTALQLIDNIVQVEDGAHSSGHSGVMALGIRDDTLGVFSDTEGDYEPFHMTAAGRLYTSAVIDTALPAGTAAIGKLAANSGVDIGDVDVTSISAGSNLIGDVGIQGRATGGTTTFRSIDLDETEEEVKATAGTIYSIAAFNLTAAPLYLKLYNLTAANTTVGTSTPTHTYVVPGNADSDGAGFILNVSQGIAFSTAISAAVTTGVADADTGAPAANACVVDLQYV